MLFSQDYREILKHEYTERVKRNPRYSLRAFSKLIGLAPARVSDILLYKKGMSSKVAQEVGRALQFTDTDIQYFCYLVESLHARNPQSRRQAKLKVKKFIELHRTLFMQVDTFEMISDINYLALIQLLKIHKKEISFSKLASSLGIEITEVENMLSRLIRLRLISKKGDLYEVEHETIKTPDNVPSDSIKNIHQQLLHKAMNSMQSQPITERDFYATVMPLSPKSFRSIQSSIREFAARLYGRA